MALATFTSTMPLASADYMKSLWNGTVTKTDAIGVAETLDFSLAAGVPGFVKLNRGAYIVLNSNTYSSFFTGYVTNDPELSYLGTLSGVPAWGYVYQATSDEYLLSLKPMGLVRPFMNVHMGTILKRMAEILAPGVFNLSGIQPGPLVAQYTIDPTKKFYELSKALCEAANYVFYGKNHVLYFVPQDDPSFPGVILDGENTHFTPSRLTLKPSVSTIINDATVLGDIEPQKYVTEYFIGTGLQGTFPLQASVFGVDTSVLLQEDFSGDTIDASLWDSDDTGVTLVPSNGYLNIEGGSAYLQSLNPIPLEGNVRFTHGEWDFLSGDGLICGLFTTTPNTSGSGCVYGLRMLGGVLNPVVNGSVDTTQPFTIDTTKRYILRTLAEFSKMHRLTQPYAYIDSAGTVQVLGGGAVGCKATWHTIITEIDPTTGLLTKQSTFTNDGVSLGADQVFATYAPVVSGGLHATVSGITISVPINATLAISTKIAIKNGSFDDWASTWVPNGWDRYQNVEQETTWQDGTGSALRLYTYPPEPNNYIYVAQSVAKTILPNTPYNVTARVRRNSSLTAGTLKITLTGTYADGSFVEDDPNNPALYIDLLSQTDDSYRTFTGVLTTGMKEIPPDLYLFVELLNGSTDQYGAMWVDNMEVFTPFIPKMLGPNEIDAMDGLAPYATITSGNTGAPTKDLLFGTSQYNPGQSQLVFFKDSVNRASFAPTENQVVRLSYRSAGSAIGRVISTASIATEATTWGDDGHRSVIRQDLNPRPRTSYECELAAFAIVSENMFQHYEGTYVQYSNYFDNEPKAGSIFQLVNIPGIAPSFAAEQITSVKTTFDCSKTGLEVFNHTVTFSNPNTKLKQFMAAVGSSVEYQKNNNTVTNPPPVDLSLVGLNYAEDVHQPRLVSWTDTQLNFDVGSVDAGVEVRSTDRSWGTGAAKNLIAVTGGAFSIPFSLPNSSRTKTLYLKQVI